MSGSAYVKLLVELRHPMKGLINIKSNDNKCFLWCHVRHLNRKGIKLSTITKKDREIAESLHYTGINFPVSKNNYDKIGVINEINTNVFCCEDKVVYPAHFSDPSFKDCLDLLLISNHRVYIKNFNRLILIKISVKIKNGFVRVVYSVLVVKKC